MKKLTRCLVAGAGFAAAGYGTLAARGWLQYGRPRESAPDEADPLLDRFMPEYEIVERHHVAVDAPAAVTLAAACETDIRASRLAEAIFRVRALVLGSMGESNPGPRRLLAEVQSLGWRILDETPGREIVLGAVTRPWEADVTFRGLSPESFRDFAEPAYVKIAWTLRADPTGPSSSIFRTETRAIATDTFARVRFRRYWALASPGIGLIRWLMLSPVKAEAERRSVRLKPGAPTAI